MPRSCSFEPAAAGDPSAGAAPVLNRRGILAAVAAQIAASRRSGKPFALLMLHVNGLREAALGAGYRLGDDLRLLARERIMQVLRPTDELFVAGEDAFALLLPDMRNVDHALLATARLEQAFAEPLATRGGPWRGRLAIGVALYPEHAESAELLCRRAELAHDEAVRLGRTVAMHAPRPARAGLSHDELHDAIEGNQLEVYLQPIMRLADERIVGFESLSRWFARDGEIPPADFVPFAERSELISALTRWNMHATLRHAASAPPGRWRFSINLSPRVLAESDLVEQWLGALDIWGIAPQALMVELTETAVVENLDASVGVLARLREKGVGIAIDDFGTGYASFAYLRRLPATELKIDMSLTQELAGDERTRQVTRGIIDVGHHLGMEVVAEGVTGVPTLELLREMGCDMAQGTHIGPALPATEAMGRHAPPGRPGEP